MRNFFKPMLLILGLFLMAQNTTAGVILQDNTSGATQIMASGSVSQSFTAEDASVSLAFSFRTFNPGFANQAMEMKLFAGTTIAGPSLISVLFSIPDPSNNFSGFFDIDFSSVALVVGDVYTASVTADTPYWGAETQSGNPYAGGSMQLGGTPFPSSDLRFRVTPTDVPEPTIIGLFVLGLAGLGYTRRKRR